MPKYKNNKKGFTLVELLAVVIILIIIMTIAITTVNKQMEKTRKNAFVADVNIFIKAAQQKYSSDRSNHAAGEDLFHNAIEGKVCYSIDQQLIGKYAEKTSESYTGSVEVCYGEECEYAIKVWATDGEHYVDGATYFRDKKDIKKKYTTDYPLTCGVEALGGGGTGGDLLTAEFESRPEEYKMTIVKDGVYSLEAWGGQAGRYMELRGGYGGYEVIGYRYLDELQHKLDSIMLRRLKNDVLDLPEKTHITEYVEMTPKQAQIYKEISSEIRMNIDQIKMANNPLAELIRMRQATGYTGILSSKVCESAKLDRMEELVSDAIENNKQVVIFSNWTQMTDVVYDRLCGKYPLVLWVLVLLLQRVQ